MLVQIKSVLATEQVAFCRDRLDRANWGDGRVTAGFQSAQVKENLQLPQDDAIARELGDTVLRALERNPSFISAALPRHVYPPMFNCYKPGMAFGTHIDNAVRQIPGTLHRLRTDISATLFLSEPAEYDGGELVIDLTDGRRSVKLAAGDMVIYSATTLHHVAPVTRGARIASFFWIQSMIKDDGARTLLYDLDGAIREMTQAAPGNPALIKLSACYHNLVRRWSEM